MAQQRTLAMIKPDAVKKHHIGPIITKLEEAQLYPVAMKMTHLSKEQARQFYEVHKDRPFFDSLVDFISSGNIVILVLEGNDAIVRYRALMGATNPAAAEIGTIRAEFAESIDENAVHGSDSPETAKMEIAQFFPELA